MPPHLSKATVFQTGLKVIKHSSVRKLPVSNAIEEEKNPEEWIRQELGDECEVAATASAGKRKQGKQTPPASQKKAKL